MDSPPYPRTHQGKANAAGSTRAILDRESAYCDDWKVITAFYESLHWVEAFLEAKHPGLRRRQTHHERLHDVQSYLRPLHRSFLELYTASRHFRYDTVYAGPLDVAKADSHLRRIRDAVRQSLASP